MKKPEPTLNRALVREGKALAGSRWYRMPMAILLGLAGAALVFFGLKGSELYLAGIGGIFVLCALLSCLIIQKAEKTISKVNEDIDKIMATLKHQNEDASDEA